MAAKMKPVTDLATYWRREADFQRKNLPLINERRFYSIDTGAPHYPRVLKPEKKRTHSPQWELKRMRLAAAMLPKRLKRYQKVLWAIYYHSPNVDKIIASCGYGKTQYYHIWALLWDFFMPKARYFQSLKSSAPGGGLQKK